MNNVYWCIGYELLLPEIINSKNIYLYDQEGKKYIDLESGVWCTSIGHNHSRVNKAIFNQSNKISHTGYCYSSSIVNEGAKAIAETTDISNGKCVFLSSGSEAVEFGIQVIKKLTNKPMVLSLSDSFLGSYGSARKNKKAEWHLINWKECESCSNSNCCDSNCNVIKSIPFDQIGGFIFEPGSASGAVRFPPDSMISCVASEIRKNNGLIQVNEITTGIGRTGKWYGYQHYSLKPDIISIGKGLGNGYPVSSTVLSSEIVRRLEEKSFIYSQSHQNDPLGCSIAKEVINVIKEGNLIKRSEEMGDYFKKRLEEVRKISDIMIEVRNRGLMIAIEINNKTNPSKIFKKLLKKGFIVGFGRDFLRIDPPLLIEKAHIDQFIETFKKVLINL